MLSNFIGKRERHPQRLIFEEGDIVLARCSEAFPEPATIHSFRGYDVDEQEVHKVVFFGGAWAYLPSYFIRHLSYHNVRQLCQAMKNNYPFVKSLIKAEALIQAYGETLGGKFRDRFDQIYLSDKAFDMDFFGQQSTLRERGIESSMSFLHSQISEVEIPIEDEKTRRKRYRFSRCRISNFFSLSVAITQAGHMLNISIKMNGFVSNYRQEIPMLSTEQSLSCHPRKETEVLSASTGASMLCGGESESTSVDEGDSGNYMDVELFRNIQRDIKQGFEKLQKYIIGLKQKNHYGIQQRYMQIDGLNLPKIEAAIKEIIKIINLYRLTTNQIKLLFDNLNRFLYIFIEYHSSTFLIKNLSKIKDFIYQSKDKTTCLERVPILKSFELTYKLFGRWLGMIKEQEKISKLSLIELGASERLRKSIADVRHKYSSALSQVRDLSQL